jgi:transcriptional regulator with XRE-family HTH domain
MTGTELQHRRTSLGLSIEKLADALDEHRDTVARWEQVTGTLPRALARCLDWALANEERARLMQASGIEECSWIERHLADLDRASSDELERRLHEAEQHAKTCPTCQRREAFAATLPPLPPIPLTPPMQVLTWLADRLDHLPRWARPAAVGAILIGALTILRALLLVAFQRTPVSLSLLLTILGAIGLGAYGGAVGGFAYGLVRARFRRFGRLGDYLTGLVCAYAYLLAFGIPLALFTGEEMFRDPVGWVIMVILGAVFGVVIGHLWFRETGPRVERGEL